jgi:dolichol kinase
MLTWFEVRRQLIHIFLGVGIVLLLNFDILNGGILFAMVVAGFAISFLSRKFKIPVIYAFLRTFDRKGDLGEFPGKGAVFYVFGAFLAVLLFPKNIAMASIMILALGDSVSRLIGPYGYLKHPFHSEKFLEGVIAGAVVGFFGALVFVWWLPAALASVVAMLIEGIELRIKGFKVDDNLIIPVIAGAVILVVDILF